MSADDLRQAAETLRTRAQHATPGNWKTWGMSVMADQVGDSNVDTAVDVAHTSHEAGLRTFNAVYICTVDPRVGLALADWLDKTAVAVEHGGSHALFAREATAVASLINGRL